MKPAPKILDYRDARVNQRFDTGWKRRAAMHFLAAGAFLCAAIALAAFVTLIWLFVTPEQVFHDYDRGKVTILIVVTFLSAFLFAMIGTRLLNASAA